MNQEQILKNEHISTDEIIQDITDTNKEIKDFKDEKIILERNPVENKVKIYMLSGKISSRQDFINDLQDILDYRKSL